MGELLELYSEACAERIRHRARSATPELWNILDEVTDPEIPVLCIWDLGVLQDVTCSAGVTTVIITPTWSGCPAMEVIAQDICAAFARAGVGPVIVETRLAPAWTTDWMTSQARAALRNYGIAPPGERRCPQCGSEHVELISKYASTACKSLLRCLDCHEPFDAFKQL